MSQPLLSYIVPVYNTEPFLLRCLRSIVQQGLEADAYEVLVVDDGSTDGSKALVQAFIDEGHPQVRLLTQPNSGVSTARNLALDSARGIYLQFVDSDDFLLERKMSTLLESAVSEHLDVLVFNYNKTDGEGHLTQPLAGSCVGDTAVMTGVEYLEGNTMTPYIWRYLIRRELIENSHWRFNPSLIVCEDGDLIARFMLAAKRVMSKETSPYCYVDRGDSAMRSQDKGHLHKRIFSQIDAAASINNTIVDYQRLAGKSAPASVGGLRNVYLFFSLTKALTSGCVEEAIERMKGVKLYPFPCVGPEANYSGVKWRIIHRLMMCPSLWSGLSKIYCKIKN